MIGVTPSPRNLGLRPETWRKNQLETIEAIRAADEDVVILDAPPGAGKSLIALGTARLSLEKTLIVTKNKSLQDQYVAEAGELARSIKGKSNYQCVLPRVDPSEARLEDVTWGTTVDEAPCVDRDYECKWRHACPYFIEKRIALAHPISIHNFSYWMPESNYLREFTDAGFIFADEGHLLDEVLTEFHGIGLSPHTIASLGGPPSPPTLNGWVKWAEAVLPKFEAARPTKRREVAAWERVCGVLARMTEVEVDGPTRWVLDYKDEVGVRIRPVWPPKLRESIVKHGNKLVIMSGTILDHRMFSEMMGITGARYIKLPWSFPAHLRPVFYRPAAEVTRGSQDAAAPNLARVADHIISQHPGEKGIIHSRSFSLGASVARALKTDKILVHERGQDRTAVVRAFKASSPGTWLISPSVGHGEDFAYDLARCQIILKMPMPDYGDPLIRSRAQSNPAWYYYATAQELVQEIGRVNRADDDYGETYIVDSKFDVFTRRYRRFIPEEIWDAVQ